MQKIQPSIACSFVDSLAIIIRDTESVHGKTVQKKLTLHQTKYRIANELPSGLLHGASVYFSYYSSTDSLAEEFINLGSLMETVQKSEPVQVTIKHYYKGRLHGMKQKFVQEQIKGQTALRLSLQINYTLNFPDGIKRTWDKCRDKVIRLGFEEPLRKGRLHGVFIDNYNGKLLNATEYAFGRQHGLHKHYNEGKLEVAAMYDQDRVVSEVWYKPDEEKEDGIDEGFHGNGSPQLSWHYHYSPNGVRLLLQEWNENGIMTSECRKDENGRSLSYRRWRRDGTLCSDVNYINGFQEGPHELYEHYIPENVDEFSPKLLEKGFFHNGHKQGQWLEFQKGSVANEWNYNEEGDLHGVSRYYSGNSLLFETHWKHGLEHGASDMYDNDGKLQRRRHYVDGEKVLSETWDESGELQKWKMLREFKFGEEERTLKLTTLLLSTFAAGASPNASQIVVE